MSMTGFTQTCAAYSGGVNTIHLALVADVTSMTLASAADYYDTITMASSNVFKAYDFDEDTAKLTTETVYENGATKTTINIEFKLGRMTKETRTAFQEMLDDSACGMIGIVTTGNGDMIVAGYSEAHTTNRPLRVASGAGDTGNELTSENGQTVVLSCQLKTLPHYNTATIPV